MASQGTILGLPFQRSSAVHLNERKGNLYSARLEQERVLQVLLSITLVLRPRSACGCLQPHRRGKPVHCLPLPAS